jgi:hypothetical protein
MSVRQPERQRAVDRLMGRGRLGLCASGQPGILAAMSSELQARDPDFEERVRASFAQQGLMSTFAAELDRVEPGSWRSSCLSRTG